MVLVVLVGWLGTTKIMIVKNIVGWVNIAKIMIIYQRKESMDSLKKTFNQWELKPLSNQIIEG